MTRVGIIYYSRSGTGQAAAERLAQLSKWPIYEIQDEKPRVSLSEDIRCIVDTLTGRYPPILYDGPTLHSFDHTILISPVWLRSSAAPMRTFLQRYGSGIENYSVICVQSGYGGLRAVDDIATIVASVTGKRNASQTGASKSVRSRTHYQNSLGVSYESH